MKTLTMFTRAAAVAVAVAFATACDDDDDDIVEPPPIEDVVVTFRDQAFNFGAVGTFELPDSIVHLVPANGVALALSRAHDDEILDRVRQNMRARGYVENTTPGTLSDVIVLVGASASQQYNAWVSYAWWDVWGFYDGFFFDDFDETWGLSYVWTVQTYERGTIIVDMISTRNVNPLAKRIASVWAGAGAGILDDDPDLSRVYGAIDEMFAQSPYLAHTP
jgi:hypothetical protein